LLKARGDMPRAFALPGAISGFLIVRAGHKKSSPNAHCRPVSKPTMKST